MGELIGAMLGSALLTLLLLGAVRLFKGARTRRGVAQLAVITLSLMGVGQCGSLSQQARPSMSQDQLQARRIAAVERTVAEVSKNLPRQIDDVAVLFGVARDHVTIVYSYRFVNMLASEVDPEKLVVAAVENLCGQPVARDKFLKQGIGIRSAFHEKTGAMSCRSTS